MGRGELALPDPVLVEALVAAVPALASDAAGVHHRGVTALVPPDVRAALDRLRDRLVGNPFDAPETPELAAAGLTDAHLAAATRRGELLRMAAGVYLLPTAPQRAAEVLAGLAQPFTLSAARQALDTSRRVAVPLLELLDRRLLTRRVDDTHRAVRPPPG